MKGFFLKSILLVALLATTGLAQDPDPDPFTQVNLEALNILAPLSLDANGGGARAKGMGNAFLAVSDDATAVSWNPAGLYKGADPYVQPVMALSYFSLSASNSFRNGASGVTKNFDLDETFGGVGYMSILAPIRLKGHPFVISGAYTHLGDESFNIGYSDSFGRFYSDFDELMDRLTTWSVNLEGSYHSGMTTINAGFGTRLYNDINFGFSINSYGGKAVAKYSYLEFWDDVNTGMFEGNQLTDRYLEASITDSVSFSGVYFTFGFLYEKEKLSAGLILKTPHTLKELMDERRDVRAWDNVERTAQSQTLHIDDILTEVAMPMVLGGGIAYQAMENLLVAADLEYRAFGGKGWQMRDSVKVNPGSNDEEFFTPIDPEYNNAFAVRLGAEYVHETGNRLFPTILGRAGFGYVQIPTTRMDAMTVMFNRQGVLMDPTTTQPAITKWSLGTGVRWAQIQLDLSLQSNSLDKEDTFVNSLDADDSWSREYSVSNKTWDMTFTGFF